MDFKQEVKEGITPLMDEARKLRAALSSDIGSRRKPFL
jgi:hypothetical protein